MNHRIPFTQIVCLFALVMGVAGCAPLDPLDGGADQGNDDFGVPNARIESGVWTLKYVARQPLAYSDIDQRFLNGQLPESVNVEMEADDITRHRVLQWGQLQLQDNGFFRLILQYDRYAVRPGVDIGPVAGCRADIRGLYGIRSGTLVLYPERLPVEKVSLQLDAEGQLRGFEIPNTCAGVDAGQSFESDILLRDPVFKTD